MLVTVQDSYQKNCSLDIGVNCGGPECMAWRWYLPQDEIIKTEEMLGYCGLAGAPLALQAHVLAKAAQEVMS